MAERDVDPIEKTDYTKLFFVLGSLFFLFSVWAFYDEFIHRRSWKGYQAAFNKMELQRTEEEREKLKAQIVEEDVRKILLKIEEAEIKLESPEVKALKKEYEARKIRLADLKQRAGFAKASQDEVYYEWKHTQEEGHDFSRYKKEYEEIQAKIDALKQKVQEAEGRVQEIETRLNVFTGELEKWKAEKKKYFEPLGKIGKKIEAIRARGLDIKQVVIDDLGRSAPVENWGTVDRCESCHAGINRDGFENDPNPFKTHPFRAEILGKHPVDSFGCTTCHWGQGRATQIEQKPLEEGDHAHGIVHHWPMSLLRGDFVQSSCNKCHQDQWRLDHAPIYLQGKKLFWGLGCTGCHNVKGFEEAPKAGPSLRKVASKVDEQWIVNWIKNPRDYLPRTKMPKAPLDIDEPGQITRVASYLLQSSEKYSFPRGPFPGGDPAAGKQTFETVGCLGCHTMGEKGTGLAAALDKIGSKTSADFIYNWIQDPKSYNPAARMPSLRLTPKEAADITAYLIRQGTPSPAEASLHQELHDPENAKKGFRLIGDYGCYGCHDIKGFETASKLSVELTSFGKKDIVELDFGDTKVPRTWEDWVTGKLKDPRQYLTEKTSSRMPNFGLTDEKIHALVVFLKGVRNEQVPDRYLESKTNKLQPDIDKGRRLVERLNCKGCHLIEGEGRLIEPFVPEGKAPPNLAGIGARVRPDWMFKFLKDPSRVKIRPWIDVRMPTFDFTDEQVAVIIKYFDYLNKYPADITSPVQKSPNPEMVAAGARLASKDFFSCTSCHIQGGQTPKSSPTQWGPDLAMVRERVRPEFLPAWLKNPQDFTPGVNMPAFLMSEDSGPPDILNGDEQKQAEAIRDYLMSLGAAGPSSKGTQAP